MTSASAIEREIDRNYDAFRRVVGGLFAAHTGQIALMHDAKVIEFFDKASDAETEGRRRFPDGLYSLQPVIEEPIDLGFFSHAGS